VADAADGVGVAHLVYSSVGGAERNSGIDHWQTKWKIEQYIRALGLPATMLRPAAFMENYPPGVRLPELRRPAGRGRAPDHRPGSPRLRPLRQAARRQPLRDPATYRALRRAA